jgi:hypothetical protein
MRAQVFDVIARKKPSPFGISALNDFDLVEEGSADAQTILDNPNVLLYCLDPQSKQAVFVEVPDVSVILSAPFYYISQYEHATKILKISYETMERLANQVALDDQNLIFIYSLGRSGTTVTSAAFNQAENVIGLSEPDVFSQLVQMRDFSNTNAAEISKLVRSCTLLTCKNRETDYQPVWVIKFRSFAIEIADMLYDHFPQAKSLFLYRHIESWGKSIARAFGGETAPTQEQLIGFWMWSKAVVKKLDLYSLGNMEEINAGLLLSLMWLNNMERCLERLNAGQKILPIQYEDLKVAPEIVLEKAFDYCKVHITDNQKLLNVLNKDSQAATSISRDQLEKVDWEISSENISIIQQIISEQPIINDPDYQLPGTLKLN